MKLFTKMSSWLLLIVMGLFITSNATIAQNQNSREIIEPLEIPSHYDVGKTVDFTVILWDSWGDGWNGGSMDVHVNGTLVLNDITVASGGGPVVFTFPCDEGDLVETFYSPGGWPYENSYAFYDLFGTLVASSAGSYPNGPPNISFTVVIPVPKLDVTPDPLDLGEWPIGGWQEYAYLTLENTGSGNVTVNDSELDDPDGVFALMNPALPVVLPADGTQEMVGVAFDSDAATDGVYNATYVASWGAGKSVTTADIMATAYTAPVGDIVENPFMVALPYAGVGESSALPMRSNYNLPGAATNGKDVVYMFTLAEDKELDVTITNATETPKMAIYAAGFDGEGGPMVLNAVAAAGASAMDVPLFAGDYYLVVSCEADDAAMTFDLNIDATTMPDPECAMNEMPADGAIEVPSNGITLSWDYGMYVQEYQIMFGTTYPPTTELVAWTAAEGMGGTFALPNLDPAMQYFWQVNVRNNNATVNCGVWGFTTTLTPPSNLTATVQMVGDDENDYNVVLNWTASAKALLGYNVYRDGMMINTSLVVPTTYTDLSVPYNMNPCYEYQVEAIFDEGVSAMSNVATACVTGTGMVDGNVSALLTGLPIGGADVMLVSTTGGMTYNFPTDLAGNYTGEVLEDCYDYRVSADGYITEERPGICVDYNTTVTEDFLLDEFPFPVNSVVAIATEDDQAVDVYWNSPGISGGGGVIDEDFTGGMPSWFIGDAPEADWHVTNNMLTLTTPGNNVWRSGYKNTVYTDALYQVSQQRNTGSTGGSMGVYVRGNGFADLTPGNGASANMFTWTTTGSWWYGTLTDGDLPDWSGWQSSGAINQGLGTANVITSEIVGSSVTFYINGTSITTVAAANAEGFVGGFAHESTVASEMAFDYWQIVPGGMGKNAIVLDENMIEGKGSIEECLSAGVTSANLATRGLEYDTRPLEGNKELQGYMVYRTACDDSSPLEFLGMTLDTNFRDNTWATTDWGMYKWAVEAVYTNNNSAPEFSNCLDKDMLTIVHVEVSTNSGDAPEGCDVIFMNEVELDYIYELELDATGMATIEPFRKGYYTIDVSLAGFEPIHIENEFIEDETTFIWMLDELLTPPSDLYVTPTGFATWTGGGAAPFEPIMEDFEGGELPEGWTMTTNSSQGWFFTMNGSSAWWSIPAGDGYYACSNDDDANDDGSVDFLITPMLDFTSNAEPFLTFSNYFDGAYGQTAHIKVSIDGASWVNVEDVANGSWTDVTVDLAAFAGESEVWIAFHSNDNGSWASGWAVDNVMVTDGMGKYADNKAFQFFKVNHDGVFVTDTDTTFYQYGDMGEVLVPGDTYMASVAALYSTGLSEFSYYEWTYLPCDSFAGPAAMYADVTTPGGDDVLVNWSEMLPLELIELNQGYGAPANGYYQNYGYGYGVAYDLSTYPDALVSMVDFHHASWGVTGTWDFNIHIVDWDTKTTIAMVGPFQTTGNDIWEEGVMLGDVSTGGAATVAILMEPLSNAPTDAYPDLSSDSDTDPAGSVYGDLADLPGMGASTIGKFLMDLHIYTANGGKAMPSVMNVNEAPAAKARVATDYTFNPNVIIDQQVANKADKAAIAIGTNVYRDGMMLAFVAEPDTFYLDNNLEPGWYDYCIATVYSEDDGEHTWTSCPDALCVEDVLVDEDCLAPENLTATDEAGNGPVVVLNWDAPNGFNPVWLQYDDGVNVDAIGGPTEFSYAVKWDPSQLEGFDGAAMTKVKFFPREAGTAFTLKVWKGDNAGTLVHEQPLSGLTFDAWNEVDLSTPVDVDPSEQLWVGFYVVTGGYPAGCGNATGDANSDLITLDGSLWEHLSDYGLPYSWNLGAYFEAAKGEIIELPALVDHATYSGNATITNGNLPASPNAVYEGTRALMGYNVYRDGDQVNEELVMETTYTDELAHETASYCWEVTAVYSVCGESDPSNEVCLDVFVGLNDLENNVAVYPNPATDFVMVEASSNIRSIEITNYMGQVVSSVKSVEMTQTRINTSDLSAGIYFVEVETAAGIEKVRIIISE